MVRKIMPRVSVLACLLLVVTGGVVITSSWYEGRAVASECASDNQADKVECYYDELKDTAEKNGPGAAFAVLRALQKNDHDAAVNCHFISHGIGHGAYQANPDNWLELFGTIDPTCTNGAMHGLFEAKMYRDPEPLTQTSIKTICADSPKKDCPHILGHFAVLETARLDEAAELCAVLDAPGDRGWCYTGMFMEHILPLAEHFDGSETARANLRERVPSLQDTCLSFRGNDELEISCWWTIPYAIVRIEDDPEAMFEFCNSAPSQETRLACKEYSVIIKATEESIGPKESVALLCNGSFGDEARWGPHNLKNRCYYGISMVTVRRFPESASAVIGFCNTLEGAAQEACFSGVAYAFDLSFPKESVPKLCRKAVPAMRDVCERG